MEPRRPSVYASIRRHLKRGLESGAVPRRPINAIASYLDVDATRVASGGGRVLADIQVLNNNEEDDPEEDLAEGSL